MSLVDSLKVKAFIELTLSGSLKEGIHNLIRISGLGGMKPNTVMIGFYDNALPEDLLATRPFPRKRRLLNYGGIANSPNTTLNASQHYNTNTNSISMVQFDGTLDNNNNNNNNINNPPLPASPPSHLKNHSHNNNTYAFSDLRNSNEVETRLELDAYVDIVRDVLKMRKNLCVCRRFSSLNKDALRAKTSHIFIDVWPVSACFVSSSFFNKILI